MDDHPPGASTENRDAILDAAAQSAAEQAAAPPPPQFQLSQSDVLQVLHALLSCAAPASQHLNAEIKKAKDAGSNNALRDTSHFDAIVAWCRENPIAAARIVLCSVYLLHGRYVVQEALGPHEGAATAEPREEVAAPADGSPATITGNDDVPTPPVVAPEAT